MKRFFAVFALILFATSTYLFRVPIREALENLWKPELPEALTVKEISRTGGTGSEITVRPEPAKKPETGSVNLAVPFASQAPFANWDLPYQEACEEASIIMVHYFSAGLPLTPQKMDEEIQKLVAWQNKTFGYYKDTTAEEMARILREYYGHKNVEVRYDITIDDVKREVASGHPVILPAAGRLLPNPNFRSPGPLYHALVVKGYTADKIITNDPGTRKGKDFLYDPKALMHAVHDWNSEDITKGRKAMIWVRP